MPTCNRCQDKQEYEWYQDHQEKWHLGLKLDINNYRIHKCIPINIYSKQYIVPFPDRKGWLKFICICGAQVFQSKKHFSSKGLIRCIECINI